MNKILLTFMLCFFFNFSYAASGDSVMSPGALSGTPSMSYQTATTSSGNTYSYTYITEYQTSICPSGLTVNGSSIYNSAQRITTYTYLGSQLVGTNVGSWTDIDTDCVGTQTQVIACPAGYNGTITQQRKIGTSTGGYVYGDWTTVGNSCVIASETRYDGNNYVQDTRSESNIHTCFVWDESYVYCYLNTAGHTSVVADGYTYTRGTQMSHDDAYQVDMYQIIRTKN